MVAKYGDFTKLPPLKQALCNFVKKKLLGVKQSTQNDFVYGELGRLKYQVQRYISIMRFWLKIINLEEKKYVKCIYNMRIQDIQLFPNKPNWALHVKTLLSVYDFGDIWEAQGVENPKNFLEIFKQRIKDNFVQEWQSRLENSTRARTFINIKSFKCQP